MNELDILIVTRMRDKLNVLIRSLKDEDIREKEKDILTDIKLYVRILEGAEKIIVPKGLGDYANQFYSR